MKSGLPILELYGDPRDRGRQHGEALRDEISLNVARRNEAISRGGLDPTSFLERLLELDLKTTLARSTPNIYDEILGIAEGADQPTAEVLALNLLDEADWFFRLEARAQKTSGKCTSIAWSDESGNHFVGQTMDIPEHFSGTQRLITFSDGPRQIVLTMAGLVGLCGYNDRGLAVCCNQLPLAKHSSSGVAVAAQLRSMLAQAGAEEAIAEVRQLPAATGQHFLIVDPEQIRSVECSAEGVFEYRPGEGRIAHTNHCLVAPEREVSPTRSEGFSGQTMARFDFASERLGELTNVEDLKTLLGDRSIPISKSIEDEADNSFTFGSFAMRSQTHPEGWWSIGPSHEFGWQHLEFRW